MGREQDARPGRCSQPWPRLFWKDIHAQVAKPPAVEGRDRRIDIKQPATRSVDQHQVRGWLIG
jgi:hypothetical protein